MAIAKLRVGDTVKVIAGQAKGGVGVIATIKGDRLVVKGVNLVKKAVKANKATGEEGGYKQVEASIHRSNIALYDQENAATVKVAVKEIDGKRVRVNRKTGEVIAKAVV